MFEWPMCRKTTTLSRGTQVPAMVTPGPPAGGGGAGAPSPGAGTAAAASGGVAGEALVGGEGGAVPEGEGPPGAEGEVEVRGAGAAAPRSCSTTRLQAPAIAAIRASCRIEEPVCRMSRRDPAVARGGILELARTRDFSGNFSVPGQSGPDRGRLLRFFPGRTSPICVRTRV